MKRFLMENVKYFLLFFIIIFLTFLFGCYGVTPHAHTITSTAGAGGSISPEGATTVTEGDNQIFIITPDEGFLIENVLVDGLSTGAVATYTFQNVQQDHTIQASFVGLKVYNIDTGINYDTIQEAIDASKKGEAIMVYPGTYNENILFINKDITLSSSDPSDPVIVATTIIHGTGSDSVVQFFFLDVSSLEGFTINGGFAGEGGGIDIYNSSPTIKNNTITNNTAANQGGGIFIRDSSSPTIVNNTITDNTTVMSESSGGGIYMDNSSPTIIGNAINGCSAMYGGGISMYSSSPTIKNNIIHYNFATIFGGGVYMQDSSPTITDNTITDNTASSGGGILVHGGSPTIGGSDPSDTDNFNTICGNDPDQVNSSYTYFNNYISSTCFD